MNESTALEFVELHLPSPGSRWCQLSISAEGKTEKLACGSLKTFLSHLRGAAWLDVHAPQTAVRLDGPEVFNGVRRPWFTKGTLERFVQFVSTPEVLERVKSIEDELNQLEQLRSMEVKGLDQDDTAMGVHTAILRAGKVNYNAVTYDADESKRELLRAMEVRLAALQQEQDVAFSRAVAAGFDDERMEDLLAFSDYFGADRLCVACNCFVELCKKRQRAAGRSYHCCSSEAINNQRLLPKEELEAGSLARASHQRKPDELDSVIPMRGSQLQGCVSMGLAPRTSLTRRSASPYKRDQVGRFGSRQSGSAVVRSISYSGHDHRSKNKLETSSSESEDNAKSSTANEAGHVSSPAAARRLSVQAAINLFENKQHMDVNGAQGSQGFMKKGGRRASSESSDTCSLKVELRQHEFVDSSSLKLESRQHEGIDSSAMSTPRVQERALAQGGQNIDSRPWMGQMRLKAWGRHQDTAHDSVTAGLSSQSDMSEAQSTLTSISGDGACVDKSSVSDVESRICPNTTSLANSANCPAVSDEISSRNEGRLYEKYMNLRDARMREDQQPKRAEWEAKLRVVEETLVLRKAEMSAQNARLHGDSFQSRARAAELFALKANLGDKQIIQVGSVVGLDMNLARTLKDCSMSDSSPPSPPLTPRAVSDHATTTKVQNIKKAAAASQKSTPRSFARVGASISPQSTPSGTASSNLSSISSRPADNPLPCSLSYFLHLTKENSLPSPRKSPGSAGVHARSNGALGDPLAMECDATIPAHNSAHNKSARLDKKIRRGSQLGSLAISGGDEVLGVVNAPRNTKNRALVPSKVRRSAVAPIQEARPFLRKGAGIGPGAGLGFMKMKTDIAPKSSDEDVPETPQRNFDEEAPRNIADGDTIADEDVALTGPLCLSSQKRREMDGHAETTTRFSASEGVKLGSPLKDSGLMEHPRHGSHVHVLDFTSEVVTAVKQASKGEVLKQEEDAGATFSKPPVYGADQVVQSENGSHASSFRPTQYLDELTMTRFSTMKPAVLATTSLKQLGATMPDYSSPSSAVTFVESPLCSPVCWNSSQVQYAPEIDVTLVQKKCKDSSEKPMVVVVPPKEPAKGLRQLLKFGWRSHAAALGVLVADAVSASTTSGGDDDFNEGARRLAGQDLLSKGGKVQEKLLKKFGDGVSSGDPSMVRLDQALRSSNPLPLSESKLSSWLKGRLPLSKSKLSSRLKAPLSFFSVSTSRSRAREGKSR